MKYIASCSGGKDSVATVILAHENNEPLDEVVFAEVMFSNNVSGELPEHIDFVKNVLFPKFNEWGYKTTIVHSTHHYVDYFFHQVKKSKHEDRNGKFTGFPIQRGCYMNGHGKLDAIHDYFKDKDECVQYVGIAIDEPERLTRLKEKNNKISLLEKYGYTEEMAMEKCKEYGLVSPTYSFSHRGGCWFCPNQGDAELKHLRDNHPMLWNTLKFLESIPPELVVTQDGVVRFWKLQKRTLSDKEKQFENESNQVRIEDVCDEKT